MKKFLLSIVALVFITSSAFAERYVMVTHGDMDVRLRFAALCIFAR